VSETITNTSPLVYLYRAGIIEWLPRLFTNIWTPEAVARELREGLRLGYDVPEPANYSWLKFVEPRAIPSEWLTLDLGAGELAVMALALENPGRIVLLDDGLARKVAQAAGLTVWGTLKILLEGKSQGFTNHIAPLLDQMEDSGMWISRTVRERVLNLAGE
jgi:predicted nucleic acid-binding protein